MGKAIVIVLFVSACASAGTNNGNDKIDAAPPHEDAHFVFNDAPKGTDARLPDAFVPRDAPPDSGSGTVGDGGLCTDNGQCAVAGECCVTLGLPAGVCAPGTVVLGECVPQ